MTFSFKNRQEIKRKTTKDRCESESLQQKFKKSFEFSIGSNIGYEVVEEMRKRSTYEYKRLEITIEIYDITAPINSP